MESAIEINHCSDDQPLEALVGVDDGVYFENALFIYQTLLARKGWYCKNVNAESFAVKNNWFLESVHMGLIGVPFLNGLLHDLYKENHQLEEKIYRLNKYLKTNSK